MRTLALVALLPSMAFAQQFTRVDAAAGNAGKEPFIDTQVGVHYALEFDALTKLLADAPAAGGPGLMLELPTPWGDTQTFEVHASPIMEPGLAEKLPTTKTFTARGVDDASAWGRFDISNQGLRAMIRSESGAWYIDPAFVRDRDHVISYYLRDYVMENPARAQWECSTHDEVPGAGGNVPIDDGAGFDVSTVLGPGVVIRQYRIAMSCMGEYGAYHSALMGNAPNAIDPMNAIVTNVNRVNTVFEADAGVRFVLVANNLNVVFFDPATDPFVPSGCETPASDCSVQVMEANQSVQDGAIGTANYDIGHVLTRIPGGVANLSAACRAGSKAKGASGIPRGGDNDPIGALVSVHELGHQFSAQHTFNGTRGRCAGNISVNNAYEPGSGSTQMAYPGGFPVGDAAPSDNV
ncbi:MAG TPA: zinc-dependent metalloprotease family protein, partial [Phycisphaerales bacterium]|nr:zinc-dependent metalloprotease family protein [Phycisphaerales bacterium]